MQEYSTALSSEHLKRHIEGSGVALDVAQERGYRTSTGYSELKSLRIPLARDTDTHGLLLPVYTAEGKPARRSLPGKIAWPL